MKARRADRRPWRQGICAASSSGSSACRKTSTRSDDRKEIFAEAKAFGFDTRAIRAIVKMRKMDQAERQEAEAILDLYKNALGME